MVSRMGLAQFSSLLTLPVYASRRHREQWTSQARLSALRERRLERLLARAARAPYYRRVFAERGVDLAREPALQSLARVPLLDRNVLHQEGAEAFLTTNRRALFRIDTSGSTGQPGVFYRSPLEEADFSARWARVYAAYRCGPFSSQLNIASGLRRRRSGAVEFLRSLGLLPRVLEIASAAPPRELADTVRAFDPQVLSGYSVAIESLADYIIASGERICNPRVVFCTAMEVTDHCREMAAVAFGAPIANVYVTNEFGVVGWSCPKRPGALHLNDDVFILEVVDEHGGAVADGTFGELVITALTLGSMPLLRYRIGDIAARLDEPCSCGRGLGLMTPVHGRTAHSIVGAHGERISGCTMSAAVGSSGAYAWVRRFQAREEEDRQLRLLVQPKRTPSEAEKRALLGALRKLTGDAYRLQVEIAEEIPLAPSGKLQTVVPRAKSVARAT